jgi:hypothetical protein
MSLLHRYSEYRQLGFRRLDALRLAWLVLSGARPARIRR